MSRYTKEQREKLDQIAYQERNAYRRYLRGGTQNACPIIGTREAWWRKTPERWAWLNEERYWLPLFQLKKEIKASDIHSPRQYNKVQKRHRNWPSAPYGFYDEWVSWPNLFGRAEPIYLTLPQLKKEVKTFNTNSVEQYNKVQKRHRNWPSAPDKFYDEWVSWHDLFGRTKIIYLTLPKLRKAVKASNIHHHGQYLKAQKKHRNWPSTPDRFYDEWVSWPNLFGRAKIVYLTLHQLRKAVKTSNTCSQRRYNKVQKRHRNWPSAPDKFHDEWISWPNLFGRKAA